MLSLFDFIRPKQFLKPTKGLWWCRCVYERYGYIL